MSSHSLKGWHSGACVPYQTPPRTHRRTMEDAVRTISVVGTRAQQHNGPGLSSHAVSGMAGGPEHTIPLRIFADGVGHTKTPDAYTYGRPISFTTVASGVQFETILTIVKADPCHT
jgi:hypothetical protein